MYIDDNQCEHDKSKSIEEIIENVYIIATLCLHELASDSKWSEYILPTIQNIIADKHSTASGISNRAKFKLMDLVDKI